MTQLFYYILPFLLLSCNTSSEKKEFKSVEKMNKKLEFSIESPSGRCKYVVFFERDGQNEIIFSKFDVGGVLQVQDKRSFTITEFTDIETIHKLILSIDNSEKIKGNLWKGGWRYTILLEDDNKIDVYKKEGAKEVQLLYNILVKYSPIKIDYNCF